jgi:carboxypeptidase family protein
MPALKLDLIGALLLSSVIACSESPDAAASSGSRGHIVDSVGGTVALGIGRAPSYRPVATTATGAVAGTISLQSGGPDSVVAVGRDAKICGDSAKVRETLSNGSSIANALVWVDGIASGKPLPDLRRETLTIEGCRFEPRVMGVVTKSTINVFSRDRIAHGPRFYREGAAEPIEHIQTVDAGQVVPSEKIASAPGIVEVRCSEHPFARAYIAVFDHPYFAVTDAKGAFKIDSLPPGTYTVKVWHERLAKPVEQRLVVGAGGVGRLDAALTLH